MYGTFVYNIHCFCFLWESFSSVSLTWFNSWIVLNIYYCARVRVFTQGRKTEEEELVRACWSEWYSSDLFCSTGNSPLTPSSTFVRQAVLRTHAWWIILSFISSYFWTCSFLFSVTVIYPKSVILQDSSLMCKFYFHILFMLIDDIHATMQMKLHSDMYCTFAKNSSSQNMARTTGGCFWWNNESFLNKVAKPWQPFESVWIERLDGLKITICLLKYYPVFHKSIVQWFFWMFNF